MFLDLIISEECQISYKGYIEIIDKIQIDCLFGLLKSQFVIFFLIVGSSFKTKPWQQHQPNFPSLP